MKLLASGLSEKLSLPILTLSDDGYVHLPLSELERISMQHLYSGLDEEHVPPSFEGASLTEICGYTEWVSLTSPALSVSWDWRIDLMNQIAICGLPYSNIMLFDDCRRDYEVDETLRFLGKWLLTFDWQSEVKTSINKSYS
ncbi:MAG: hypothetical protein ACJAWL_001144 [Motiliproteus sp.]|jgi:hypothetical protein